MSAPSTRQNVHIVNYKTQSTLSCNIFHLSIWLQKSCWKKAKHKLNQVMQQSLEPIWQSCSIDDEEATQIVKIQMTVF